MHRTFRGDWIGLVDRHKNSVEPFFSASRYGETQVLDDFRSKRDTSGRQALWSGPLYRSVNKLLCGYGSSVPRTPGLLACTHRQRYSPALLCEKRRTTFTPSPWRLGAIYVDTRSWR